MNRVKLASFFFVFALALSEACLAGDSEPNFVVDVGDVLVEAGGVKWAGFPYLKTKSSAMRTAKEGLFLTLGPIKGSLPVYAIAKKIKEILEDEETFLDATRIGEEIWNPRSAIHYFLKKLSTEDPEFHGTLMEQYRLLFEPQAEAELKKWRTEGDPENNFVGALSANEKWVYAGKGGRDLLFVKARLSADQANYILSVQLYELLHATRSSFFKNLRAAYEVELEVFLLVTSAAGGEEENVKALSSAIKMTLEESSIEERRKKKALDTFEKFLEGLCQPLLARAKKRELWVESKDLQISQIQKSFALLKTREGKGRVEWLRIFRALDQMILANKNFVSIPAGTFTMGSPLNEANREDDELMHRVEITNGFEMGKTEVTQLQWFIIMGENPSHFKDKVHCPESYLELKGTPLCANHPLERVLWDDVQLFIEKLNALKDGFTYRLPTEAEWEYAARAGTQTAYSFGEDPKDLPEHAWFAGNSNNQTHAVAQKKPNAFGLYDMYGNVLEWVSDWYGSYRQGTVIDPSGPDTGNVRVKRGGSWYNLLPGRFRSALRNVQRPHECEDTIGFRLVRQRNP